MNEMMQFSTLTGMSERLYVLPFDALSSGGLSRRVKEDLQSDSSDRTKRWRLAGLHILVGCVSGGDAEANTLTPAYAGASALISGIFFGN